MENATFVSILARLASQAMGLIVQTTLMEPMEPMELIKLPINARLATSPIPASPMETGLASCAMIPIAKSAPAMIHPYATNAMRAYLSVTLPVDLAHKIACCVTRTSALIVKTGLL